MTAHNNDCSIRVVKILTKFFVLIMHILTKFFVLIMHTFRLFSLTDYLKYANTLDLAKIRALVATHRQSEYLGHKQFINLSSQVFGLKTTNYYRTGSTRGQERRYLLDVIDYTLFNVISPCVFILDLQLKKLSNFISKPPPLEGSIFHLYKFNIFTEPWHMVK